MAPFLLDPLQHDYDSDVLSLSQTRSLLCRLPDSMRFRKDNVNPDRGTVVQWVASKKYSSFMGFSVHPNCFARFRCRMCYKEYLYSGGLTSVRRHMASKRHLSRINASRIFMGLKLLDEKNKEHSFGGEHVGSHLMEMLVGVPALPLEPFVVVSGLSPELFPA